jgi:hypothetical protein
MHFLNKARLLVLFQKSEDAEKIARDVIKNFPDNGKAIGTAYEVLSWIEELKQPDKINKRKEYTAKGLDSFHNGYALLVNAFEVAIVEKNTKDAIRFLTRAVLVNKDVARKNLVNSPL